MPIQNSSPCNLQGGVSPKSPKPLHGSSLIAQLPRHICDTVEAVQITSGRASIPRRSKQLRTDVPVSRKWMDQRLGIFRG